MIDVSLHKMRHCLLLVSLCVLLKGVKSNLTLLGPKDETALVKRDATLVCNLTNSGSTVNDFKSVGEPFTVVWTFSGVNDSSSVEVLSVTSDGQGNPKVTQVASPKYQQGHGIDLIIKNVSFVDAGTYSCGIGSETHSAELYVLDLPKCHIGKTILYENEEGVFDCSVVYHGNRPPQLTWEHDHHQFNSSIAFQNDSYVMVKMKFRAKAEIDGFLYRCHAKFPNTGLSYVCLTDMPLKIFYSVHGTYILLSPDDGVYDAGTDIKLRCVTSGDPYPNFQWVFTPLGNSSQSIVLTRLSAYKIINADAKNSGNYTCIVSNELNGTTYTDSSTLFLKVKERIIAENSVQYGLSSRSYVTQPEKEEKPEEISLSPYAVGALVSLTLAVVLIAVFIALAMKFRARENRYRERFSRVHDELMDDQEQVLLDENIQPSNVDDCEPQYGRMRQYWEIPRRDIRMMDLIATGSYCEVWRGRMRKNPDTNDIIRVTIKKVLEEASEQGRKFFLAEMEVLKMIKSHPNIICLIGCYTLNEPWLLMLEYAHEGTLLQYLMKHRQGIQEVEIRNSSQPSVRLKNNKIDSRRLLALAAQVASGLQHLTKFKLIYYRLSASSVLVSKGGICKLSGFGFTQYVTERNLYEKESLPVRWMAPESIRDNIYNIKSDVWSYGVLVWELLHFGLKPYPCMESDEVVDEVLSGYRMTQPLHCSAELYTQLLRCWKEVPENRPNYSDILHILRILTENHSSHIVLEDLPYLSSSDTDLGSGSL